MSLTSSRGQNSAILGDPSVVNTMEIWSRAAEPLENLRKLNDKGPASRTKFAFFNLRCTDLAFI